VLELSSLHYFGVLANDHKVDVICLQETHVHSDEARHFSIPGLDLISYLLHPKHGRATYVRNNITRILGLHIANVYKSPSAYWDNSIFPVLTHQASSLEILTVTTNSESTRELMRMARR